MFGLAYKDPHAPTTTTPVKEFAPQIKILPLLTHQHVIPNLDAKYKQFELSKSKKTTLVQ